MRVHYDQAADALYLRLNESPIKDSEEVRPGLVVDFDANDQVVGIELRRVSIQAPSANLKEISVQVA